MSNLSKLITHINNLKNLIDYTTFIIIKITYHNIKETKNNIKTKNKHKKEARNNMLKNQKRFLAHRSKHFVFFR